MKQALYYSIASAAVAGLLTGGVMKLGPDALADVGGPQILVANGAKHSLQQDSGRGEALFTSNNGEIPEYVIGTDWTQPQYATAETYYHDASYQEDDSDAPTAPAPNPNIDDAVFTAPVKISSPPKLRPVSYPSIDGDVVGHDDEAGDIAEPTDGPALAHVVEAQADGESLPS